MIFLFIILAICLIFALQPKTTNPRTDDLQKHTQAQRKKYQEPYAKKQKQMNLYKLFRGTLDDDHIDIVGDQVIKHQEAEAGYVILNGVKRKIDDCKNL